MEEVDDAEEASRVGSLTVDAEREVQRLNSWRRERLAAAEAEWVRAPPAAAHAELHRANVSTGAREWLTCSCVGRGAAAARHAVGWAARGRS